uniref:Calsyntenin-1 n=1 Tax=Hemiscolopendra marginata TaxID=943146 RepID=A0A646QFH4_9MYRI
MGYSLVLLTLLFSEIICSETQVPKLDLVTPELGYHGLIKENELTVEVTPKIRAVGADICSFRIVNKPRGEAPFSLLMDKEKGEAKLVAKKELNCEKRKNYKFSIAAISCDGEMSENVTVHVAVMDVNEYEPRFKKQTYIIEVDEGRLYDEITQVEAEDEDCSPKYGDICKYEILGADQPFAIDLEGKIKNTEALEWEKSHNHILNVVAYDCGMKHSKPAMVTIKVNRVCHLGWKEIQERIEYTPGSGRKVLFPGALLELCEVPCQVEHMSAKITLATQHIGKGCDRDTYSVESQRKLCGASADSVDLLPTPGIGAEWTKSLPTDDGHESDQIYEFDGVTNAVVIPPTTMPHNLTDNFTISSWMKHRQLNENNSHVREYIICNADDHKMGRPHYALFVRNCRLILLLRRDYTQENMNTFKPAEWRWKLSQVCDNEWHHYAVNVNFPEVVLYVDGQKFHVENKNPEVIDDWPLHKAKGINTTLVVGACWHGGENKMEHHFKGFLAGLAVLRGKTEKAAVLSCLHKCKESLEVPGMELLEPGMELLNNNDLTEVAIEGNNKTNLETLVQKVAYANSREFPTPGRRNLKLYTSVTCTNGKTLKVPVVESYTMVLQPEQPTITINGTPNIACDYESCKKGIKIFQTISILVSQDEEEEENDDISKQAGEIPQGIIDHKLDSCTISVLPPLNSDLEYFTLPDHLMERLGIVYKQSKDGIIISGADMIYNYAQILRQIHYVNRKPAYYLNRAFKLICSELNGRFVSNEYLQTLSIIHPQMERKSDKGAPVAHAQIDHHHLAEFVSAKQKSNEPSYLENSAIDTSEAVAMSSASHTVTIIIVVCVGFLVFMIVLGVIRIRAAHQRAQETREDDEMAWDDSSLTITVNPMDQIEEEEREAHPLHDDDDSDSSDDNSSYHDELESSEDEAEKVKDRELEWDDSTLTF